MASNNYTSANVTPSSDTFREWVDLTNRITYDMEKVVVTTVANSQGAHTAGNAYVNGAFSANTLAVTGNTTVMGVLKGTAANSTVYGTAAASANLHIGSNVVFIANSTANAIIHAQSNAHFAAGIQLTTNSTSNNVTVNAHTKVFESNAVTNIFNTKIDANANVDIDNALTDITSTNLAITGTETNIDANAVFTANVNITSAAADFNIGADEVIINSGTTLFQSNAATNRFNTIIDANANVDIDAGLVDIAGGNVVSSSNVSITGVNTSITSTKIVLGDATTDDLTVGADSVFNGNVQVTGALVDVDQDLNVDGDVTLNANLVIGSNNSDGANIQSLIVSSIEPSANGKVLGHADRRWAASLTTANTSGDITAGADVDITGEVNAASAAIVGAATVGTTLGVTGVGTFGNDVDITGEVNAATAAIVGAGSIGGDLTLSGDLDAANNKEANVFNAVVRNDLTVTRNSSLTGNTTIAHNKDFIVGNSTIKTLQSNQSGNVRSMVIGQAAGANDRIVIQSSVGNSSVGFIPLQGNNVTLGNTTNRWHNASFTNANTSGTFVSTGDITGGADVDITGEANTSTLRVRSTSAMAGKLTVSTGGASITGSLDTVNNANVGGNAAVTGVFAVTNTAALGNTTVTGFINATTTGQVGGLLTVGGNTLVSGKIAVTGNSELTGNTTVTGFVNALGTMEVGGVATFKGATTLGDAVGDTVTINGNISRVVPSANGNSLGISTKRWAGQLTTLNASGDITAASDVDISGEVNAASGTIVGDLSVGDDITLANTGNIVFSNTGLTGVTATTVSSNLVSVAHLNVTGSAVLPDDTTLTASTLGTANLTVTDTAKFTGSVAGDNFLQIGEGSNVVFINAAAGTFKSSIIAADDNSYDVGNTTTGAFRSGYFDTSVTVGTTVANTTALLADFVYAKQDLIANFSSDQQLKDKVLTIDTALDKVESLGGYSFVWNNNIGDMRAGTPDYGVIAQEVENVLPHAVDINSRGHKTVNYNSLIPLLIEAVKELSARVKELEPEPEIEPEEEIDG